MRPGRIALWVLAALTAVYLVLPVFIVIPTSFSASSFLEFPPKEWSGRWYENFFTDPVWLDSALASLRVAVLVTLLSLVLGTAAALGMVRGRYRLRALVSGLVMAPVLVPYVIVGLAVYATFLELGLTQTTLGFVLVHTALAVPYVVITVSSSLVSFDRRLEQAAMSLGAGPVSTFARVTLPLIAPGLAGGAVFAFVTSFDEVVTGVFLSGPDLTTLPVQMWSGVRVQIDPTVAAVSTMLLLVTLAVFATAGLLRRRKS
ncbi:ABC transporter permease [Nonomuraea endophytica]|uniref:Putative spermidine/putrescine transport system permease protein n=1 Tax=Nonomuraea endophytica TaxID=714136 RepID=A0A7W8A917_9ACTN|nr:ABC transporter permease [Nonomuraea endophytica]MBB5081823.1 putative spermidine/putrescine transport system permease protein [Nonomuraea endophytica]